VSAFVSGPATDSGVTFSTPQEPWTTKLRPPAAASQMAVYASPRVCAGVPGGGLVPQQHQTASAPTKSATVSSRVFRTPGTPIPRTAGRLLPSATTPTCNVSRSTDAGATFSADAPPSGSPPGVYYSSTAASFRPAGQVALQRRQQTRTATWPPRSTSPPTRRRRCSNFGDATDFPGHARWQPTPSATWSTPTTNRAPFAIASARIWARPSPAPVTVAQRVLLERGDQSQAAGPAGPLPGRSNLFLNVYQNELKAGHRHHPDPDRRQHRRGPKAAPPTATAIVLRQRCRLATSPSLRAPACSSACRATCWSSRRPTGTRPRRSPCARLTTMSSKATTAARSSLPSAAATPTTTPSPSLP